MGRVNTVRISRTLALYDSSTQYLTAICLGSRGAAMRSGAAAIEDALGRCLSSLHVPIIFWTL